MLSTAFRRSLIILVATSLLAAPCLLFGAEAPPVRTIYLVRHGAYLPDPKANPQAGPGLTPLGVAQARLTGARLRSMPVAFDTVTSSTMTRAQETAVIVHEENGNATASSSALISECTPPAPDLPREQEAQADACKRRFDAAFEKFFVPATDTSKHDVLVCHGNVIRYLLVKALGVDTRAWIGMSVAHTSVSVVEVHADGAIRILSIGDVGHIPANMQSWGDERDPQLVPPQT